MESKLKEVDDSNNENMKRVHSGNVVSHEIMSKRIKSSKTVRPALVDKNENQRHPVEESIAHRLRRRRR